jgi:hypothetical protein
MELRCEAWSKINTVTVVTDYMQHGQLRGIIS